MSANLKMKSTDNFTSAPVLDQKVEAVHRQYKKAGSFTLTGLIFAPANRPDPSAPISLSKAWLPLGQVIDPALDGIDTYRHDKVIPTLGDQRVLQKVGPILSAYAEERDYLMQPVLFFYRPQELDSMSDDDYIKSLPNLMRQLPLDERIFIDLTAPIETGNSFLPLLDMCLKLFGSVGYKLPSMDYRVDARKSLNRLITDHPFLVHHIFKAYPKLRRLCHEGRVGSTGINSKLVTVNHIVYNQNEVHDVDVSRVMRDLAFPVTL